MTTQALPPTDAEASQQAGSKYPVARPLLPPPSVTQPVLESDTQSFRSGVYSLDGNVVITSLARRVQADHIDYDTGSHVVTAAGHVLITGGPNDEVLSASRGTFDLDTSAGTFFDVSGSVGLRRESGLVGPVLPGSLPGTAAPRREVYTNTNPFLFTGRIVVKSGPTDYQIYGGTFTACRLPRPDWLLSAQSFTVDETQARGRNATFRLLNVPIVFLPYVTTPTEEGKRQSGFVIPTIGQSSTKGLILGEEFYLSLGRSADLTVGAQYYSSIGWEQSARFRAKGPGLDFLTLHYTGVLDRRLPPLNQGGEDVLLDARHDLTENTRAAANIEYLSSYVYREAFTDNFNQAVTTDIVSNAYLTRNFSGYELSGLVDRYQGVKLIAQGSTPQQQVRIFHAPTISFEATDHALAPVNIPFASHLLFSFDVNASGLKRSQPNLVTSGVIERLDLHPQLSFPVALGLWHIVPTVAARETLYTRSRIPPALATPGVPATQQAESLAGISRSDFEFSLAIRPPVLTRTFEPTRATGLLGRELRHTIEPELTYRLTDGVDNFAKVLRFDATDVVSNTDEAEYGVTQRLFRRSAHPAPCATAAVAAEPGLNADPVENSAGSPGQSFSSDVNPDTVSVAAGETEGPVPCNVSEELISWRLTQKYFFDQTFGGAIVNGRRNLFDTTLNLSGIAFLTEPRAISPLISRLRVRTSARTDVEWDFDLDTGSGKFTSSNVFLDLHQGNRFAALSYARLDAPGRFYTQNPTPVAGSASSNGVTSSISDFNQLRLLAGYGNPVKPGLSVAANLGLDLKSLYGATSNSTSTTGVATTTTVFPALLQYATVQATYNWNCCGLSVEYRKFELGSVRNEGSYRFNFTLVNIGAAGNLRTTQRLF